MRTELIKRARHARRIRRVRKKIVGLPDRPRLAVSRSNRHIFAQVIDDFQGKTLCGVSTQSKELRDQLKSGGNVSAAAIIGKAVAEKAKELGVEKVSFDRRGRRYHGRVKAVADAAREAGLKF
jgi:large subunit ribosomal protein L18